MTAPTELYPGIRLLKSLSRRVMLHAPLYIERDDLIHAGWLAMHEALEAGKGWGYAKRAAWGEMINELSRWIGIPPRVVGRFEFLQFAPRHHDIAIAAQPNKDNRPILEDCDIAHLPSRQRECFQSFLRGETLTEIGRRLGISAANVQTHIRLACQKLRMAA